MSSHCTLHFCTAQRLRIACWHPDGGTPVTYPGYGTGFMLPLSPPYDAATVVICGGTWGYNNYNGAGKPLMSGAVHVNLATSHGLPEHAKLQPL